jgi:nicotinamide-nucleotide amidase
MKAEIITIGTELLIGHVLNSNSRYLSEELNALGIGVYYHSTVGDNPSRIHEVLDLACKRSDLILITGGLGPTSDDITHESIAEFFNLTLVSDSVQKQIIKEKFASVGNEVPPINYKQASSPKGSEIIPNPVGTAIGIILKVNYQGHLSTIITFPGVPIEMEAMLQETVIPFLKKRLKESGDRSSIMSKKIRMMNITESRMAQIIKDSSDLFDKANPSLAPYAVLGECYLRITAQAETEDRAQLLISETEKFIHEILGEYIFGYNDESIHEVLSDELKKRNLSISFVESCTGGLLSKLMTDIPGSSKYSKINLITYSNESKEKILGVKKETLEHFGAVSLETALEMSAGLSKISEADLSVSITGIAGPDGGSQEKPIGTIYWSIKSKKAHIAEKLDWTARKLTRSEVRELAAKKAFYKILKLIREGLI